MIGCPECSGTDYGELRADQQRDRTITLCQCNICGEQFRKVVPANGDPYTVQEVRSE